MRPQPCSLDGIGVIVPPELSVPVIDTAELMSIAFSNAAVGVSVLAGVLTPVG